MVPAGPVLDNSAWRAVFLGARHSTRRLFSGRGFAGMVGGRTILVPHYIFILAGYLCVCYLFTTVSFSAFALFSSFCCRFVYKKCQMLRKRLFASLVTSLSSLTWPDFLLLLPPPVLAFICFRVACVVSCYGAARWGAVRCCSARYGQTLQPYLTVTVIQRANAGRWRHTRNSHQIPSVVLFQSL